MASKRRIRRVKCQGKRIWPDKDSAFKHAGFLRRVRAGETFDAYVCPMCGKWHVGHRPRNVQQSIDSRREQ